MSASRKPDDEPAALIRPGSAHLPESADILSYDFYKHMSNLSLVTLGGMLTLGGTIYGDSVSPRQLGLAAFLVICAGVLATKGAIDIVRRRGTARPHSRLSKAVPALVAGSYGGGIGAFLFVLLSSAW